MKVRDCFAQLCAVSRRGKSSRFASRDRMICPACNLELTCQQCHDLRPCVKEDDRPYLAHRDWILALRTKLCQGCYIILKVVEKIQPALLETSGGYVDERMKVQSLPNGLMYISRRFKREDRWLGQLAAEVQLYSPDSMCIYYGVCLALM